MAFRRSMNMLPEGYQAVYQLDLSKDMGLLLKMNAAGLLGLAAAAWGLLHYLQRIRPTDFSMGMVISPVGVVLMLAALVVMVVLHEGVHAVFFWAFTGARPQVGMSAYYAYAAAKGWYFRRPEYTVVGLAPLAVLSLLGVGLLPNAPAGMLPAIFLFTVMNAAGSVGDVYIIYTVWRYGSGILIEDLGDGFVIYKEEPPGHL